MTRAPSIKSLQKCYNGISVDDAKRIRSIIHKCSRHIVAHASVTLAECDDILKGYTYGIEQLTDETHFRRLTHLYLNTGDTYKGTIFYNVKSGNFYITDMGTVVGA